MLLGASLVPAPSSLKQPDIGSVSNIAAMNTACRMVMGRNGVSRR